VSPAFDSDLPSAVRAALLEEIKGQLPAFLHKKASERHDPVGDVRQLLNLEQEDLKLVVAVHGCLDESVLAFGSGLREGMRSPITASTRPREEGQAVRGPVDWSATLARRSLEAGNSSSYVVRSARRVFDVPENRALAWLLDRLRSETRRALARPVDRAWSKIGSEPSSWPDRIRRLAFEVDTALRTDWLREVPPERPSRRTVKRLRAARSSFYAETLAAAVRAVLELDSPSAEVLTDVLCRRYFEPAETWLIFEVCVALRLSRAFEEASGKPRKARLLVGAGGAPFARYGFADGSEVSLRRQTWPDSSGPSLLQETSKRHRLRSSASRPDLFIVRSTPNPDAVLLELKASYRSSYLGEGLSQLLRYIGDRPATWKRKPGGWLVAPASDAFEDHPADAEDDLWIVSAEEVAAAAVARFVPAELAAAPD
jgi:hypothetical protein